MEDTEKGFFAHSREAPRMGKQPVRLQRKWIRHPRALLFCTGHEKLPEEFVMRNKTACFSLVFMAVVSFFPLHQTLLAADRVVELNVPGCG